MKIFLRKTVCFILLFTILCLLLACSNQEFHTPKKDFLFYDDSFSSDAPENPVYLLREGTYKTEHPIQIKEINKEAQFSREILNGVGEISQNKALVIDGVENPLMGTFKNPEESFQLAQTKYKNILVILKNKYQLPEFNQKNWQVYYRATENYCSDSDSNQMYEEQGELLNQFYSLQAFMEIDEDTLYVQQFLKLIQRANDKLEKHEIKEIFLDEYMSNFSEDAPIHQEYERNRK